MRNIEKRGGIWRVRIAIPADLRAQWGKREEIISLHTADENEAIERAAPIIATIKRRVKALRNPAQETPAALPLPVARLRPEQAFDLIQAWRFDQIDTAYAHAFDPVGEPEPRDAEAASRLRYDLSDHNRIDRVDGFTERLATVLNRSVESPVLAQPTVREWFRVAWLDVETYLDRFSRNDFNGWPEDDTPVITAASAPAPSTTGMTLSELRDAWNAVKPLEGKEKGRIRRLIEFLGDVDIAAVTPIDMDRFLIELRRFPLTKKPDDEALSFLDLIARYADTDQPTLHVRTVWLWTTTFKAMFEYAVSRRLIAHNPASAMMKKPSADESMEIESYTSEELEFIFTRPMYSGFSGRPTPGYRKDAGSQVIKDARYWLPVVALHSGMRLDEMVTLRGSELIEVEAVLCFDLRLRPLKGDRRVKNKESQRLIPIHKRLFDLGFVKWAKGRKPDELIFADLPEWTSWWGRWCRENAPVAGDGIDRDTVNFHSFRHTFKRAARVNDDVKEDIADLLMGHKGTNAVSRSYGRGADIATLKRHMDRIEIRWP